LSDIAGVHRDCANVQTLVLVGLASSVLQFVDFAQKLVSKIYEIYNSSYGMLKKHVDIKGVTEKARALADALKPSDPSRGSEATECKHMLSPLESVWIHSYSIGLALA
jgi:hypothetical protein